MLAWRVALSGAATVWWGAAAARGAAPLRPCALVFLLFREPGSGASTSSSIPTAPICRRTASCSAASCSAAWDVLFPSTGMPAWPPGGPGGSLLPKRSSPILAVGCPAAAEGAPPRRRARCRGWPAKAVAIRQDIRHRAQRVKDEFAASPLKYMVGRRTRGARRIPGRLPTVQPAWLLPFSHPTAACGLHIQLLQHVQHHPASCPPAPGTPAAPRPAHRDAAAAR